ncbi:UPF0149 family protein [Endozoicomonadaceae bacterium StTr2]
MSSFDSNSENAPEQTISFDDLCDVFLEHGCHTPPSELHGLLTGWLCGGGRSAKQWMGLAAQHLDLDSAMPQKSQMQLLIMLAQTLRQLKGEGFGFDMLLPDDETEMEQRINGLSHWCNGFLAGFGLAGKKPDNKEVEASLKDLANLAAIESEGAEEGDEAERDWLEVSEYVRVAALMIFSECNAEEVTPPEQQIPGNNVTRH